MFGTGFAADLRTIKASVDILHLTDLFPTAARLGGALSEIPNDQVADGVDQTALLLLGEDHGRRNLMFFYSGGVLGSIRYDGFRAGFPYRAIRGCFRPSFTQAPTSGYR